MTTKKDFIDEYKKGTPIADMANKFGVSKTTINTYARKLGLSRGKGNRINNKKAFNF